MKRFDAQRRRLAWVLCGVFAGLVGASALLVVQSMERLRFEALHGQRVLAEELVARINQTLAAAMAVEDARPPTDYDFLVVAGERYVQRSPLSTLTPESAVPGVVGYFQVDPAGRFSTPLLPADVTDHEALSLTADEFRARRAFEEGLRRLLESAPAEQESGGETAAASMREAAAPVSSSGPAGADGAQIFHKLSSAATANLARRQAAEADVRREVAEAAQRLTWTPQRPATAESFASDGPAAGAAPTSSSGTRSADASERRSDAADRGRDDSSSMPLEAEQRQMREVRQVTVEPRHADQPLSPRISAFRSAVDAFLLVRLDAHHLVAYRKVWLEGQRIQGLVIRQQAFLDALVGTPFSGSSLARFGSVDVTAGSDLICRYAPADAEAPYLTSGAPEDAPLLRAHLAPPAQDLELTFRVAGLPLGPGAATLAWAVLLMAVVLLGGLYLLYRLGHDQIRLAEQQQDFVSAVSHELKTPLTSIRMYGEILKAGWADEERRQTYYDYILSESERLSRLIGNVLQLARITRSEPAAAQTTLTTAGALLDQVQSKIASAVTGAGLELRREQDEAGGARVRVDEDGFMQVMINLVDNAIKFSAHAEPKALEIGCRRDGRWVEFRVRDFGPGVAPDQMRRIFELFYRAENELTRETVGTGIGLALVRELVAGMGGSVDVINRAPGAEFHVRLPSCD